MRVVVGALYKFSGSKIWRLFGEGSSKWFSTCLISGLSQIRHTAIYIDWGVKHSPRRVELGGRLLLVIVIYESHPM